MKAFIKKTLCLMLIFSASSFMVLTAQTAPDPYEEVFLYAQKLEQGGALEEAEIEYKRYIFLQDFYAGSCQTLAFERLAALYENKGQWELAVQTQQQAIQSAIGTGSTEPRIDEQKLEELRLEHINKLYNSSLQQNQNLRNNLYLFSYMNLPDFSDQVKQQAFCTAILNAINQNSWEYAQEQFDNFSAAFPLYFTEEEQQTIAQSFSAITGYKPKNLKLAGYLSLFPGLGQLYAGDYLDSLNAFLLNGSIIAVSVYSLCTLDFWTFSLLEFNPLVHFMKGNMYNAQKDAYEHNTGRYAQLSAPIIECIKTAQERNK